MAMTKMQNSKVKGQKFKSKVKIFRLSETFAF